MIDFSSTLAIHEVDLHRALHLPDGPPDYEEMPWEVSSLEDVHEQVISLLPLFSGFLSILGSTTIIFIALNNHKANNSEQKLTSYTRLLLGMSFSDIVSSLTLMLSPFLLPRDSSQRVWAGGTDGTCSAMGFMQQLSLSSMLYNAFLSYYFLLSARYGWNNARISKWVEPLMHVVSIGYPLATATSGSIMGVYHESELVQACWVSNFPEGCDEAGEPCKSIVLAWIFGGTILLFTFFSIAINNAIIWGFMRRQTFVFGSRQVRKTRAVTESSMPMSHSRRSTAIEANVVARRHESSGTASEEETDDDLVEEDTSLGQESDRTTPSQSHDQLRRLKLVTSQVMLYVGAFFICTVWTFVLKIMESKTYNAEDDKDLFPLLVLQAMFLPLQGFFNVFIFVRPKFLKQREQHPEEPRIWTFKRCVHGEQSVPVMPTSSPKLPTQQNPRHLAKKPATKSIAHDTQPGLQKIQLDSTRNLRPEVEAQPFPTEGHHQPRRKVISSITCEGFDDSSSSWEESVIEVPVESEWRWTSGSNPFRNKSSGGGISSLEAISEVSAVSFVDPDEEEPYISSSGPPAGALSTRSVQLRTTQPKQPEKARRVSWNGTRVTPSHSSNEIPSVSSPRSLVSYVRNTLERVLSSPFSDDDSSSGSEGEGIDPSFDRMASTSQTKGSSDAPIRRPARRLSPQPPLDIPADILSENHTCE